MEKKKKKKKKKREEWASYFSTALSLFFYCALLSRNKAQAQIH